MDKIKSWPLALAMVMVAGIVIILAVFFAPLGRAADLVHFNVLTR